MDSFSEHHTLESKLSSSFSKICDELRTFDAVADEVNKFETNPALQSQDDLLMQMHRIKSHDLEMQVLMLRKEMVQRCKPKPVCVNVCGFKVPPMKTLLHVKYDTGAMVQYEFMRGEMSSSNEYARESSFDDTILRMTNDPKNYICMTPEEISTFGFTVGKPMMKINK